MKKAICFFCDISGTLNGTNKNNDIDYQNLNSNLLLLMKKYEAEYLFFSLVSSDKYNIVNDVKEELEKQLNSPILFKKQFFENGYILDDKTHYKQSCKTEQMMGFLDEIEKEFDIQSIIYADDCEIFHDMIGLLTEEKSYHHKIISITPQKKEGLSELNQLLESKITQKEKILSYKII